MFDITVGIQPLIPLLVLSVLDAHILVQALLLAELGPVVRASVGRLVLLSWLGVELPDAVESRISLYLG